MATVPSIPAVSTEYVHVPVTSDVTLSGQAVEFAYLAALPPDDATTWTAAEWEGNAGTTRSARSLIGPVSDYGELAAGTYTVWVRVTDETEIPVRPAGTIKVI
jgi:hypothetical protein